VIQDSAPVILNLADLRARTGAWLGLPSVRIVASSSQDFQGWNVGKKRSRKEGPSSAGRRSFSKSSGPQGSSRPGPAGDRPRSDRWPVPKHAAHGGTRNGLNEDQRGLATRYLPMAQSLANAFEARQRIERDELQSTAYMALVQAARTFDPYRKVNFATYARHRIRGALRDYMRYLLSEGWRGEKTRRPSFQSLFRKAEEHGRVLGMTYDEPAGAQSESMESVEAWLRRLPEPHGLACRLIYLGGKKQEEVAQLLGFSSSHVSRMHAEALSLLIERHETCSREENRPDADGLTPENEAKDNCV
jgi:RNA polymerase sigma factor (sigma-70 family)